MSRSKPPAVLVDSAVLDGSAHALPLSWLKGMDLLVYPPRRLLDAAPQDLQRADAVLVRSMTRIASAELARLPQLRAVATLSSGLDHLDEPAIAARQVPICSGHGGNAAAVADWVEWAAHRLLGSMQGRDALVVGVGAVGSLVAERLRAQGARLWLCDPPRARRDSSFASIDLAQVPACALVTLHVPLADGEDPTRGLWNAERLRQHPGSVVLQASRGGVMDEAAALAALGEGGLRGLAVDTWVGEPLVDRALLTAAALATPHIAGHSIAGKLDVAFRAVQLLRLTLGLAPLRGLAAAVAAEEKLRGGRRQLQISRRLDEVAADLAAHPDQFDALRHQHKRCQSTHL